eukprot:3110961-Prymnesium_polylepis.1
MLAAMMPISGANHIRLRWSKSKRQTGNTSRKTNRTTRPTSQHASSGCRSLRRLPGGGPSS